MWKAVGYPTSGRCQIDIDRLFGVAWECVACVYTWRVFTWHTHATFHACTPSFKRSTFDNSLHFKLQNTVHLKRSIIKRLLYFSIRISWNFARRKASIQFSKGVTKSQNSIRIFYLYFYGESIFEGLYIFFEPHCRYSSESRERALWR